MKSKSVLISNVLIGLAFGGATLAQSPVADGPISEAAKVEVIRTLEQKMKSNYVFPDVAERTSTALEEKSAKGAYATATTAKAFAKRLEKAAPKEEE